MSINELEGTQPVNKEDSDSVLGNFAHEIKNILAGSKLFLDQTLFPEGSQESMTMQNVSVLKNLIHHLKDTQSQSDFEKSVELIKEIASNEEQVEEVLQRLHKRVFRVLNMTNTMMKFEKSKSIERGDESVTIKHIIEDILNDLEPSIQKNKLNIKFSCEENYSITGNQEHYHSIFHNLIINARDALLEVDDGRQKEIQIHVSGEKDALSIFIEDNGIGIPQENIEKIFRTYFSTKKERGNGFGMGLVKEMIELYDGKIDVESEVNKGTKISVQFHSSNQ